jgi:hypothetical protein
MMVMIASPFEAYGNAFNQGMAQADQVGQMARKQQIQDLYQTQGQGIAQGDPAALNALAQLDPEAAMGMRNSQAQYQATQQGMAADQERLSMARTEAARQAAAEARDITAEQATAASEKLKGVLSGAMQTADKGQWDAWMTQNGIDPEQYRFEDREMLIAKTLGLVDYLDTRKAQAELTAPPKPLSPEAKFEADKAAGLLPQDAKRDATGTTITNVLGGGSDKQVFDEVKASADAARLAAVGLNALKEAESALSGGAITGFGADTRLGAAKLGAWAGITDPAIIQNTETFRAAIAPQVAAMMKATVGSTQISNADREFAEKAAGGSIALDEGTITRLLKIMTKASEAILSGHLKRLDAVYPPGQGYDRERALFGVDGGPGSQPQAGAGQAAVPSQAEADALLQEFGVSP